METQRIEVMTDPFSQRWRLYISYTLSAWGNRTWEFASVVFLVDLFGGSLLYASLLGLLENVVGIIGGPFVGKYLDRTNRLVAVRRLMVGQNLSVTAVSILFGLALLQSVSQSGRWAVWGVLLVGASVCKVRPSVFFFECAGTTSHSNDACI